MLKQITLAAGYAMIGWGLASMPAHSETYQLSTHGNWTVSYNEEGGNEWCDMTSRDTHLMSISTSGVDYSLMFFIDMPTRTAILLERGFDMGEIDHVKLLMNRTEWTVEPDFMTAGDTWLHIGVYNMSNANEFRRDIVQGSVVYIPAADRLGTSSSVSLRGSAEAWRALDKCAARIGSF